MCSRSVEMCVCVCARAHLPISWNQCCFPFHSWTHLHVLLPLQPYHSLSQGSNHEPFFFLLVTPVTCRKVFLLFDLHCHSGTIPFSLYIQSKKITIFQSRRGRFKSNKVKLNANNYLKPRSKLNNRLCSWWFSLTLLTVATHQEFHWLQAWVTPRTFQCQFCSQCTSEIQVRQN